MQRLYPAFRLLPLIIAFWLVFAVLSHAWVSDDAYITFRTVEHILAGHGAVWNIDERVQAYTHPLWMLLHVPAQMALGNIYLATLLLSLACFTGAVWLTVRGHDPLRAALLFLLPLSLSRPLMDYATGGLENPLSMLLVAWFAWLFMREKWHWLSLCSALLLLTRFDFALLIAPAWLWLFLKHRAELPVKATIAGALPLLAWCSFSLVYYGFLFPNTKYAKLNTGIPASDMAAQGFTYFLELIISDFFSAIVLLMLGFWLWKLRGAQRMLAAGAAAYSLYIIAVGGDFMSGRFWTVPLFISLWLLLNNASVSRQPMVFAALAFYALSGASYALHHSVWSAYCPARATYPPADDITICTFRGISDERAYYADTTGLLSWDPFILRTQPDETHMALPVMRKNAAVGNAVGLAGYYAPSEALLIDTYGLTEPLLARLPVKPGPWRIGHFERELPKGFLPARTKNDFSKMDKELAEYYRKLKLVTSGPLWSRERLAAILELNAAPRRF